MIDIKPKDIVFYTSCLTIMILPTWDLFIDGSNSQIFQNWLGPATAAAYCIIVRIAITLLRQAGMHVLKYERKFMLYGSLCILIANALRVSAFSIYNIENLIFILILLLYIYISRKK